MTVKNNTQQNNLSSKEKSYRKKYQKSKKYKEYCKKHWQANKERIREYKKANKQKLKDWYDSYKEERRDYNRIYRKKNKKRIIKYHCLFIKNKKTKDSFYKFLCNIRTQVSRVVKQLSLGKKPTSTFKWVGCSLEELKSHFESLFVEGMSWCNYGEWHIDHIRPVSSFKPEEWEQINHYTNLQPLWAEDNFKKSNKF